MPRTHTLIAIVLSLGVSAPALAQTSPHIVTTGEASISVSPDMARITIGVDHFAETASDAIKAMSDDTSAILDHLAVAGLAPQHIQTSGLQLMIERDYNSGSPQPFITGYRAQTRINAAVHDLDILGEILAHVVDAGANRIDSLSFDVADPAPHQEAARRAAVADARARALVYAEAADVTLGDLLVLAESGSPSPGPFPMEARMQMDSGPVPVAAGEISISASVTMTYAIAD